MNYFDYSNYINNEELINKLNEINIAKRKKYRRLFLSIFLSLGSILTIIGITLLIINPKDKIGLSLLIIGCIFILISFTYNVLFPKTINKDKVIKQINKNGINL